MSPQALEDAVAKLHDNCYHDNHEEEQESDEGSVDVELTKTEALSQLLKSKGKAPLTEGKAPMRQGETPVSDGKAPKRPRLSRRGSFFDNSDSETECKEVQNRLSKDNAENDTFSRPTRKQFKSRQLLNSSDSDSDSETDSISVSTRKRTRPDHTSSDSVCEPDEKCSKLSTSDSSESDNDDLIMDLGPLQSPPANTVDLCPLSATEESNYDNQSGSMATLAITQSVVL